jgi:hypothetical protein
MHLRTCVDINYFDCLRVRNSFLNLCRVFLKHPVYICVCVCVCVYYIYYMCIYIGVDLVHNTINIIVESSIRHFILKLDMTNRSYIVWLFL